MTGEPVRAQPKPVRAEREPKRLQAIGRKKAARIAAGEARPGLARTWMKKHPPKRLSRAGSDPAYLASVRTMPCLMAPVGCEGRIHAHHAIHRSQGGVDRDAVPLCLTHHHHWHHASGPFRGFSKPERAAWADRAIRQTQRQRDGVS